MASLWSIRCAQRVRVATLNKHGIWVYIKHVTFGQSSYFPTIKNLSARLQVIMLTETLKSWVKRPNFNRLNVSSNDYLPSFPYIIFSFKVNYSQSQKQKPYRTLEGCRARSKHWQKRNISAHLLQENTYESIFLLKSLITASC